jgi:hypothetical protein
VYLGFVGVMRFKGRYTIVNHDQVRTLYKEIVKTDKPLIICANHLTFIDSALIVWALGSLPWYLMNYKKFSWNLPAGDVFKKNFFYRIIGYIAKCIFIHRDGSKEHKTNVLAMCKHLLQSGEIVTIFPEGRRSRSGIFESEKMVYGVGKLVAEIGPSNILCIYLRSDKQKTYTNFPPIGSNFHVDMRVIETTAPSNDRDGYAVVVKKVSETIKSMETNYFKNHPAPQQ